MSDPGQTAVSEQPLVLIVEDDAIVRQTTSRMVGRMGYPFALATNGREALEALLEHRSLRLVLLDLDMPVMSGREAYPLIRERHPDAAIVILSGKPDESPSGMFPPDAILPKPFRLTTLTEVLARLLGPPPQG